MDRRGVCLGRKGNGIGFSCLLGTRKDIVAETTEFPQGHPLLEEDAVLTRVNLRL